jgi:tetratricopeptide (TPR) repeat protein
MEMHPETTNIEAFDLVARAQSEIEKYSESLQQGMVLVANERLRSAAQSLNRALVEDPRYLSALYYRGVVQDLRGKASDAVKDLLHVLRAVEEFVRTYKNCWPTMEQVKYNLAVAYYHRYGHPNLEEAARYFKEAMQEIEGKNRRLYCLAQAGVAQAYAMRMIPSLRGTYEQCLSHLKSQEVKDDVDKYFKLSRTESDGVLDELKKESENKGSSAEDNRSDVADSIDEINWIAYNARAISLMYYTDFNDAERLKKLNSALHALEKADTYSPKNWSVYCNFGSAHMRLGHWLQVQHDDGISAVRQSRADARPPEPRAVPLEPEAKKHFDKAEERLREVVNTLLRGYGFALYELGRIYRLMGKFDDAVTEFAKARAVPVAERAVSDDRLNFEEARAKRSLTDYP